MGIREGWRRGVAFPPDSFFGAFAGGGQWLRRGACGAKQREIHRSKSERRRTVLRRYAPQDDGQRQKKKQVPHPSALRAYGLRMTAKSDRDGKGIRPTLQTEGSGTRKGWSKTSPMQAFRPRRTSGGARILLSQLCLQTFRFLSPGVRARAPFWACPSL